MIGMINFNWFKKIIAYFHGFFIDNNWEIFGESDIGPHHIKNGIPNQDSWMAKQYNWGSVVVVSDGLGSKKHSDHGSQAACLAVLEAVKKYSDIENIIPANIIRLIHKKWLEKLAPYAVTDCLATCLFVIQSKNTITMGRLGDGLITALGKKDDDNISLEDNKQGSFSNYTQSLNHNIDFEQWEIITVNANNYKAVTLCTDGISDDLLPEKQQDFCKSFVTEFSRQAIKTRNKSIKKMLKNWPVPHHSDDKTIACLVRVIE